MISKLNMIVMKFEGDKPDINDYVEYIDNKTVRKWELGDFTMVIGVRAPTARGYGPKDDEILIQLQSCIDDLDILDIEEPQPLFTSTVDARGRLTIRSDVRQRKGISAGDMVDVFEIEKVIIDG